MGNNPFFDNWFKTDISNALPGFGSMPVDMKNMMEAGRKTFQAITEAQQLAVESFQTIAQRQSELMSQFVQDQSAIARDIIKEGTPEEKIARATELLRKSYEKTISGSREVADLLNKSTREAGDILNSRVTNALSELKSTVEETRQPRQASEAA